MSGHPLLKEKPKAGKEINAFLDWLGFYLRMAAINLSFNYVDSVRIVYHISAMSVACVSGWYMFYLKYNDLSVNTDALLHAVLVGHTLFVYLVYLLKRENLSRIAHCMQEKFSNLSNKLSLDKYKDIWDEADKFSLILMKLGIVACVVVYMSYILNALSYTSDRKILYPLFIPFSIDSNIKYLVPIILQLTIFSLYSFIHVSGCGFCIGGSHFIGASFQVLGKAFQDVCKLEKSKHLRNPNHKQLYQAIVEEQIKLCVDTHIKILRVTKDYKTVYEGIIVEVLLSCEIIICFAGFQIVLATEAGDYLRGATVLTMALLLTFHLFMFCYPGQHIYNKSEEFRNTLYLSHWEDLNPKHQRMVHIMLLNSLQPVSISFHAIITASMSSFLNALKTAFSYINILLILRGVH